MIIHHYNKGFFMWNSFHTKKHDIMYGLGSGDDVTYTTTTTANIELENKEPEQKPQKHKTPYYLALDKIFKIRRK